MRLKKLLSVVMAVAVLTAIIPIGTLPISIFNISAESVYTSGYYKYTISNKEVTITEVSTSISGDIVLPSKLSGYPVTQIGEKAFYDCRKITSITIPDSVTSIGNDAFDNCTGLTSVTIGNSVMSIGDWAFYYCTGLTSITIPDSVTSIGDSAFAYTAWYNSQPQGLVYAGKVAYKYKGACPANITIKDGTFGIANSAFYNCDSITSVTIPNSLTSIGNYAFSGCAGLTSITIPDSVVSIADSAFSRCTGLTSVAIPNSVTSIGTSAFLRCIGLTSITIPDSVTSIGNDAFEGCTGLTSVTIGNSVTSIGDYAFSGCFSLESINIPIGVKSIGVGAFEKCSGITSVSISKNVTFIASGAFADCTELTSIVIPDSVAKINGSTFKGCAALSFVQFGKSVSDISHYAFSGCLSLETLIVDYDNKDYYDFDNCIIDKKTQTMVLGCKNSVIPSMVTSIGPYAFQGCSDMASISIPQTIKRIEDYAFADTVNLTDVYYCGTEEERINTLTISYGNDYFRDATWHYMYDKIGYYKYRMSDNKAIISQVDSSISGDVSIPPTLGNYPVVSIDSWAFNNCSGITSIIIPNGVVSIGSAAFWNCINLEKISVPDSVTSIDASAFENTAWLNNQSDGLIYAGKVLYKCLGDCPKKVTIKSGTLGIAGSAFSFCWDLEEIILPDSLKNIGLWAFYNCESLMSINIPNGITEIASCTFSGCESLKSVVIGEGVQKIDEEAFSYCPMLENISINKKNPFIYSDGNCIIEIESKKLIKGFDSSIVPNDGSVTSIGRSAFSFCTGLTSITIPDSVTSIGDSAFSHCYELTSITIPNSVTAIGEDAFNNCAELSSITIPNSVTSIGDDTFLGCVGLSSITIPDSVTSIGRSAFSLCTGLTDVYYTGTEQQRVHIIIANDNDDFFNATWHYNYVPNCTHSKTETRDAKAPSCTEAGYTGDTYCSDCGEKITEGEVIAALGHGKTEIRGARESTCTERGYSGDTYCTVCGEKIAEGKSLSLAAHALGEWQYDSSVHWRHCEACDNDIGKASHSYVWQITKVPEGNESGLREQLCPTCGYKTGESIKIETLHPGHIAGDINGDGKLNNKDLTRLFQYLSDWDVDVVADVLDVNGDGSVNNKDLTRLFQFLSDWGVEIF